MARCHRCDKKLGIVPNVVPSIAPTYVMVYHMDGQTFCPACAELWPAERKNRAMAVLSQGGEPKELFSVPRLRCIYLEPSDYAYPSDRANDETKKQAEEAYAEGAKTVLAGARGFTDVLNRSPRLIIFPRARINTIDYSWTGPHG